MSEQFSILIVVALVSIISSANELARTSQKAAPVARWYDSIAAENAPTWEKHPKIKDGKQWTTWAGEALEQHGGELLARLPKGATDLCPNFEKLDKIERGHFYLEVMSQIVQGEQMLGKDTAPSEDIRFGTRIGVGNMTARDPVGRKVCKDEFTRWDPALKAKKLGDKTAQFSRKDDLTCMVKVLDEITRRTGKLTNSYYGSLSGPYRSLHNARQAIRSLPFCKKETETAAIPTRGLSDGP